MFFISRRVMRGRQGKSLIITGIVLLVIGLAITVGSYALASSRGGGHYITFTPIIVGIIAIVRGISQTRRGNVGYGGPGQEIPQAGYQQPAGYGAQNSGAPRAYDQPGYAVPHYGAQGQAQAQGQGTGQAQAQGTGGAQGQPAGQPAPNWYQDPQNPAMVRWWDGRAWTPHTQPRA
jgi:hypothetical protein